MTELFGVKMGTTKTCANLLHEVLEIKFRKITVTDFEGEWYVAESSDGRERIVLAPNKSKDGEHLEPYAPTYEVLLYIDKTHRHGGLTRKLATETTFRFLEASEKLRSAMNTVLN